METPESLIYCRKCGYCLIHLQRNRCPECGNKFDPDDADTYDVEPTDHRYRSLFVRVTRIWVNISLVWLAYAAEFYLLAFLFILAGSALFLDRRKWLQFVAVIFVSPLMFHSLHGIYDYCRGTACLRSMSYAGLESVNVHPVYRCKQVITRGNSINGENFRNIPYNTALQLMITAFGPIENSYIGPYPTREEALTALENASVIPVLQVFDEKIEIGGSLISLRPGFSDDLLYDSEWRMVKRSGTINPYTTQYLRIEPVTAVLYRETCLILRVSTPSAGGNCSRSDLPCAVIALIDADTGKLFACYATTENEHFVNVPIWE